jgi:hypothetical protein
MYCFAIALPLMHGWSVIARVLLCHCCAIAQKLARSIRLDSLPKAEYRM